MGVFVGGSYFHPQGGYFHGNCPPRGVITPPLGGEFGQSWNATHPWGKV